MVMKKNEYNFMGQATEYLLRFTCVALLYFPVMN